MKFKFLLLVFFIWRRFETPNVNSHLPTKQCFLEKLIRSNTIQIKFVNFKKRFAQFRRKITGYADMLMMYINYPLHGHIPKFTNETVFL